VIPTYPRGTLCFQGQQIPITDIRLAETETMPHKPPPRPFTVHLQWVTPAGGESVLDYLRSVSREWLDSASQEERDQLDLDLLRFQFDAWCEWVDEWLYWERRRVRGEYKEEILALGAVSSTPLPLGDLIR
jgi:hypothetical protein